MKTVFVDSNVFLRFFTISPPDQHRRARRLFRGAAAGDVSLVTGPPVLFEVAWTLRSTYEYPRDAVLDVLARIAAFPGLNLIDGLLVQAALRSARHAGQEFADAYIYANAIDAGTEAIATFNRKDFARMGAPLVEL